MSKSLQEQLLKKGLIDNKKAKAISKEKYAAVKNQRRTKTPEPNNKKAAFNEHTRAQKERDRELNLQQKLKADKKALTAQIIQIVEQYKLDRDSAELEYNFSDTNIVKKILVSPTMSKELSRGRLCIVRLTGSYEVIPKPIADKIQMRDANSIVVCNDQSIKNSDSESDDDYYAQFKIPDDLTW